MTYGSTINKLLTTSLTRADMHTRAQTCAFIAGDSSMLADNRTAWSVEDYNLAVARFNELWPEEKMEELCR
jgi:hypothetical protein